MLRATCKNCDLGGRREALVAAGRHPPRRRIAADAQVDAIARRARRAVDDREVVLVDRPPRHRARQRRVDRRRLRDQHDPRGVAIEAMDEMDAAAAPARRAVREQRVHQRAGRIALRRVHDEPGRLVDGEERVVLVEHGERPGFGERAASAAASGRSSAIACPGRSRCAARVAGTPSTSTRPSRIHAARRVRDSRAASGSRATSSRSSRSRASPRWTSSTRRMSVRPAMTRNPRRTERSGYSGHPRRGFGAPEGP